MCVASEASSRKLMDLLSKRELHGQNPIVTPCNKQSLSQFEMQSRKSKLAPWLFSIPLFEYLMYSEEKINFAGRSELIPLFASKLRWANRIT